MTHNKDDPDNTENENASVLRYPSFFWNDLFNQHKSVWGNYKVYLQKICTRWATIDLIDWARNVIVNLQEKKEDSTFKERLLRKPATKTNATRMRP